MRFPVSRSGFFVLLVCVALLSNCKNEHKNKLPNTPEQVVVSWQRFIDLNLLDSARMLSTPYAQGYIAYLDSLSFGETLESDFNPIIDLKCEVAGDSATAHFFFEDEVGEKMPGKLVLKRTNGQWLVDRVIEIEAYYPDTLNTLDEQNMFPDSLMKD